MISSRIPPTLSHSSLSSTQGIDEARQIQSNLLALSNHVEAFEAALALLQHAGMVENLPGPTALYTSRWRAIALRDGAMTVHHFIKIWREIYRLTKLCPFVLTHMDCIVIKAIERHLYSSFPNANKVRNGITHRSENSMNSQELAAHSVTELLPELPGTRGFFIDVITDDAYWISIDGKLRMHRLTDATLLALVTVRDLIFDAFDAAERAITGHSSKAAWNGIKLEWSN